MDFNEALSHARQMGNRARAFSKIEEVLCTAAQAEQATLEAEAKRMKLDEEISRLSGEKGRLQIEVDELAVILQDTQEKNEVLRASLANEHNKQIHELEASLEEAVKLHDEKVEVLEADLEKKIAAATEELGALDVDKKAVQGELSELQEKVNSLKNYIMGAKEPVNG